MRLEDARGLPKTVQGRIEDEVGVAGGKLIQARDRRAAGHEPRAGGVLQCGIIQTAAVEDGEEVAAVHAHGVTGGLQVADIRQHVVTIAAVRFRHNKAAVMRGGGQLAVGQRIFWIVMIVTEVIIADTEVGALG
ncbi:MAG: hypothetical protein BWY76_02156 [bacterium ADurb.Bin429]|nr:MAG: hypothetical protein BWY76_02156 [bacterium ADurb.Bin429]